MSASEEGKKKRKRFQKRYQAKALSKKCARWPRVLPSRVLPSVPLRSNPRKLRIAAFSSCGANGCSGFRGPIPEARDYITSCSERSTGNRSIRTIVRFGVCEVERMGDNRLLRSRVPVVDNISDLIPTETSEEQELLRKAHEFISERGLPSLMDELSWPVTRSMPKPLIPYICKAILDVQSQKMPMESISLRRQLHPARADPDSIKSSLRMQVLSTNCPSLDELLGGGIPVGTGGIVEVSGKAGVGKTQLAIQLALMSVAPLVNGGLQSRSIYAFTEGKKAPDRILAMERALCQRFSLEQGSLLSGILLENIGSSDELQKWTEHRLPYLMRTCDVRVIIVDSVTAVYRLEFGDPLSRANHLVQMVSGLKAAAGRANGVCVCVNQVSQAAEGGGDLSATVPALGAAWGNCVSMRVFLSRMGSRRFAKVLESSWVPVTEGAGAQYRISAGGVVNPDDYRDAEE